MCSGLETETSKYLFFFFSNTYRQPSSSQMYRRVKVLDLRKYFYIARIKEVQKLFRLQYGLLRWQEIINLANTIIPTQSTDPIHAVVAIVKSEWEKNPKIYSVSESTGPYMDFFMIVNFYIFNLFILISKTELQHAWVNSRVNTGFLIISAQCARTIPTTHSPPSQSYFLTKEHASMPLKHAINYISFNSDFVWV